MYPPNEISRHRDNVAKEKEETYKTTRECVACKRCLIITFAMNWMTLYRKSSQTFRFLIRLQLKKLTYRRHFVKEDYSIFSIRNIILFTKYTYYRIFCLMYLRLIKCAIYMYTYINTYFSYLQISFCEYRTNVECNTWMFQACRVLTIISPILQITF